MTGAGGRRRALRRFTIGQTFLVATLAVAAVLAAGFYAFLARSRTSILEASERQRESTARRVESEVAGSLRAAERALSNLERFVRTRAVAVTDEGTLELLLYAELVSAPHLAEVTFTGATFRGYDAQGEAVLDPEGRFQQSVFRAREGHVVSRRVQQEGPPGGRRSGGFVASSRSLAEGPSAATPLGPAPDPTTHPTYSVIAAERHRERTVWSDLHYSELTPAQEDRRVVLSVQRPVLSTTASAGTEREILGVLRVALLTSDLDAIAGVEVGGPSDPHHIALLAVSSGRDGAQLVARVGADDTVREVDGELRIVPRNPPAWLSALLASSLVRGLNADHPDGRGDLRVEGSHHLATLRQLSNAGGGTAGWVVAVVVPESYYTAELVSFERTFLGVFGVTLALVLLIGGGTLTAIRRGLAQVVDTTARMRQFDFSPGAVRSRLHEIDEVMLGLERAKTVARAMGRYVPLDLVRGLYEKNREPELGGEARDLTLLFTDIEGFTTLSERLPPDELALRLGDYLEVFTTAVQRTSGTIDKYIGDAVMAFWNAPAPVSDPSVRACEAVLECKRAATELYASPRWAGLPALTTRFGVHSAGVLVGNFGAKSRLAYTALGDGVNLAARLEPLCKQYGVTVLVSECVAQAAREAFSFRRVDRVAVKGKTQGVEVFELIGRAGEPTPAHVRSYERAFEAYLQLDFAAALSILETHLHDEPSAVLAARCREYAVRPPPASWNGVHVARSK